MNQDTTTMRTANRLAAGAAALSAGIAVMAGITHGFGKDDETMYGSIHIALGHLLPVLVAAGTLVWLTSLHAGSGTSARRDLVWLCAAQIGLSLWIAFTAVHSLGLYIFAHVDPSGAAHADGPTLAKATFVVSLVSLLIGTAGALTRVVRRHQAPAVAAILIGLGTPAAFFVAPIGDFALAAALGWAALYAARSRTPATVPAVPVTLAA